MYEVYKDYISTTIKKKQSPNFINIKNILVIILNDNTNYLISQLGMSNLIIIIFVNIYDIIISASLI